MHYTAEDDGLSLPWHGVVFVNPPYGRELPRWVAKARAEVERKTARVVVALIPASTDTHYWHEHVAGKADVYFLRGRLRFGTNGQNQSAPFPSALAIWGADLATVEKLDAAFPDAWKTGITTRPQGGGPVRRHEPTRLLRQKNAAFWAVPEMRAPWKKGINNRRIAERLGVSRPSVIRL